MKHIWMSEIDIECPQADVFDYVVDRRNYHRWFPGIIEMVPVDDSPAATPGKRYVERAMMPGNRIAVLNPLTVEIRAPECFAMDVDLKPVLPRFEYRFEKLGDTHTRFSMHVSCRARAPLALVGQKVMGKVLGKRGPGALRRLKTILEAKPDTLMRGAEIREFGPPNVLAVSATVPRPRPQPGELLVRIDCASLNPIDVRRRAGYGAALLKFKGGTEWPITLGSDFAGTVVDVGPGVSGFQTDDRVFGCKPLSSEGTHAEYVAVDARHARLLPDHVPIEAGASLAYAWLTAWAALVRDCQLKAGEHVFVNGGSGGVGMAAILLAKSRGCTVSATCAGDAQALVRNFGADVVIDYQAQDLGDLETDADIVLDCVGNAEPAMDTLLKRGGAFATVVHPLLSNADTRGVPVGLLSSKWDLAGRRRRARKLGVRYFWSTFDSCDDALDALATRLESGVEPAIQAVFPLEEIALAHAALERGHARGKTLIKMT